MLREAVLPGSDPGLRFVGQIVIFDLHRTGGTKTREKGEIIDQKWLGVTARGQIPEYEVVIVGKAGRPVKARLVMSIIAAGFGINGLQEVCSHIGIAELMYTDSKHQQASDRLHRIGQKSCVNAYYFLARGTIDDDMWEVVAEKARINASAVDGEEDDAKASVLANLVRKLATRNENPNPIKT